MFDAAVCSSRTRLDRRRWGLQAAPPVGEGGCQKLGVFTAPSAARGHRDGPQSGASWPLSRPELSMEAWPVQTRPTFSFSLVLNHLNPNLNVKALRDSWRTYWPAPVKVFSGSSCPVLSNPPRTPGNLHRHKETPATAAPPLGK